MTRANHRILKVISMWGITGLLGLLSAMSWVVAEEPELKDAPEIGNAWNDPRNPIRVLYQGERLDLWSLQPIHRSDVPTLAEQPANPIDSFLEAAWQQQGRRPAPMLDRAAWIQRATLDLTGLRATQEEVDAFVADASPDAYERVIDRLFSAPTYGEHAARLWLDVVRYSDSNGFDWDEFRKTAWRYRDWVIKALNSDLPFDRFVLMQLAGDELLNGPPRDPEEQDCLIATGYLRLGPYDNAAKLFNEQDRARVEVLTDLTETTASAFLGLTMSCCRCHDHKTDPLSQADHYRFRAFFAATRFSDDLPIDTLDIQQEIDLHNRELQSQIDARATMIDQLRKKAADSKPIDAPKDEELKAALDDASRADWERYASEIASLEKTKRQPETGLVMTDDRDAVDPIHILYQGDHRSPRENVEPGFPSVLFPNPPRIAPAKDGASTGRRTALARWITSPDNPWTARVQVNRIWQQMFGEGLVATPNDFGLTGSEPQHPALLDYLAAELMSQQWSVKSIQRQIATSMAYRRQAVPANVAPSSTGSSLNGSAGYASARGTLKRMSAEQFRDSILQVSGLLQHRTGGPPIWPHLSNDVLQANPAVLDDNETKTKGWYPSPESVQSVRSIYLVQKRTLRLPWMETFDLPENTVSCPKRELSLVAPQALSLMNGELATQAAQALEQSLSVDLMDQTQVNAPLFVERLFQRVLARKPSPEEAQRCCAFLETRSRQSLALVLINSNEFAFIP
ncbi:MAG: DUF1549 and DUF1553 domain-containing protein [Pirellula sp.]|nr:DUF1549 and DUF1553 domain-containing protein [Pirellula sp.]